MRRLKSGRPTVTETGRPHLFWFFLGGSDGKESACKAGDPGLIPTGRNGNPRPVFLPGESHGQRSLVGYSPWGHKESDMTITLPSTLSFANA